MHVGPATVRKYARQRRVPFDTTPGGHRRFDVDEAVAALTADSSSNEQDLPETGMYDGEAFDTPYVHIEPQFSVTVTYALDAVGEAPVTAYNTEEDRDVWAVETAVV